MSSTSRRATVNIGPAVVTKVAAAGAFRASPGRGYQEAETDEE